MARGLLAPRSRRPRRAKKAARQRHKPIARAVMVAVKIPESVFVPAGPRQTACAVCAR